jgi:hypothetical protein
MGSNRVTQGIGQNTGRTFGNAVFSVFREVLEVYSDKITQM